MDGGAEKLSVSGTPFHVEHGSAFCREDGEERRAVLRHATSRREAPSHRSGAVLAFSPRPRRRGPAGLPGSPLHPGGVERFERTPNTVGAASPRSWSAWMLAPGDGRGREGRSAEARLWMVTMRCPLFHVERRLGFARGRSFSTRGAAVSALMESPLREEARRRDRRCRGEPLRLRASPPFVRRRGGGRRGDSESAWSGGHRDSSWCCSTWNAAPTFARILRMGIAPDGVTIGTGSEHHAPEAASWGGGAGPRSRPGVAPVLGGAASAGALFHVERHGRG